VSKFRPVFKLKRRIRIRSIIHFRRSPLLTRFSRRVPAFLVAPQPNRIESYAVSLHAPDTRLAQPNPLRSIRTVSAAVSRPFRRFRHFVSASVVYFVVRLSSGSLGRTTGRISRVSSAVIAYGPVVSAKTRLSSPCTN